MSAGAPPERVYSLTLPLAPLAAMRARQLVGERLSSWHLDDHVDTLALVVTELVTNAIQHGEARDTLDLELKADDQRIRLTVVDGSAIRPVARQVETEETSGRGLRIVEQLVDRWGTDDNPGGGKRVWVELHVTGKTDQT